MLYQMSMISFESEAEHYIYEITFTTVHKARYILPPS